MFKCPKCGHDMWNEYSRVLCGLSSQYVSIMPCEPIDYTYGEYGSDWEIELTCPKCGTEWGEADSMD